MPIQTAVPAPAQTAVTMVGRMGKMGSSRVGAMLQGARTDDDVSSSSSASCSRACVGKPYTTSTICHGRPLRVRQAPFTSSPLCCRKRRRGSTVKLQPRMGSGSGAGQRSAAEPACHVQWQQCRVHLLIQAGMQGTCDVPTRCMCARVCLDSGSVTNSSKKGHAWRQTSPGG